MGWSQCLRDLVTKLETTPFLQPMFIMSQPFRSYGVPPYNMQYFPTIYQDWLNHVVWRIVEYDVYDDLLLVV